jgi:hypothetical protein
VELIPPARPTEARFYPPRFKLLALSATSGLFTFIGYAISRVDFVLFSLLGWAMAVGFGLATAVMLVRTLRPGPTLVVNAVGIIDRTTLVPTGLVRWEQISLVRKREIGRGRSSERLLDVVLEDEEAFYARPRSWLRRVGDRYRQLIKLPDVSVPGSMVSKPLQAVLDAMQRWRPDLPVLGLPPALPKPRIFGRQRAARHEFGPPRW